MYFLIRGVLGFLIRRFFRIEVIGKENLKLIPHDQPAIFTSNHQAVIDSFILPLLSGRKFTFLAKSEYFTQPGIVGWLKKRFFSIGAIPVDRTDRRAGTKVIEQTVTILKAGGTVGMHPEGTRGLKRRAVYRGRRGVIQAAAQSGAYIVPVALLGTASANPPGKRVPVFGARICVIIGKPYTIEPPRGLIQKLLPRAQHALVRELMERIVALGNTIASTDQSPELEYVDEDASEAKRGHRLGE